MKFHLMQTGVIGRRHELEAGMAGQRPELYQRFMAEVKGYVQIADELGYESYCSPEHHLQIRGLEITKHPGMLGLFVGSHAKRLKAGLLGYVLPTHNPVRVAEEIATLGHMLPGRLIVGFTLGYHARWVDADASVRGVDATNVLHAKAKNEQDATNREIFEESVGIVKKAWQNAMFSYKGKDWEYPPVGGWAGHPGYAEFGSGQDENGIVQEIGIAPRQFTNPHPKLYGAIAYPMRTVDMRAREGGKQVVFANDLDFCDALWNAIHRDRAEIRPRGPPRGCRRVERFPHPHRQQRRSAGIGSRAPLVLGQVVHPARPTVPQYADRHPG